MKELHLNVPNKVNYVNWKGRKAVRTIIPVRIFFGKTDYHPDTQWLIEAVDTEDNILKHFAMKDMSTCH